MKFPAPFTISFSYPKMFTGLPIRGLFFIRLAAPEGGSGRIFLSVFSLW